GTQQIGLATSTDGIHWERRAEPVLSPAEGWESGWVHQSRVVQTPEGWVMFYRGTQNNQRMALGFATSADGIVWERSPLNPILSAKAVPQARDFWFTNLLYHEGTYFLFWEVGINQNTEIYLSTHEGPLTNP
ncbi:MAG TPA: hypothetical protein PK530_16435, partial [Anaerolineales bacterium]|nr:hypothetical protein [Anaerolineales bacterium]